MSVAGGSISARGCRLASPKREGGVSNPRLRHRGVGAGGESASGGERPAKSNPRGASLGHTHALLPPAPAVIELSLSFDFEETHQSVVRGALKRAEKLLPIHGVIAII